jgi:hypothetical protein
MINPNGGEFEFSDILVAYRDADAHTALVASFGLGGEITSASLLLNDTLRIISSDISGSSALSSSHAGCPAPPTLANPGLAPYMLGECATAQFLSSVSAEFAVGPDADPALSHLAFGSTVFPGETFTSGFQDSVAQFGP